MTERSKVTGTPEVNTVTHPPHSELLFYDSHNVEKGQAGQSVKEETEWLQILQQRIMDFPFLIL